MSLLSVNGFFPRLSFCSRRDAFTRARTHTHTHVHAQCSQTTCRLLMRIDTNLKVFSLLSYVYTYIYIYIYGNQIWMKWKLRWKRNRFSTPQIESKTRTLYSSKLDSLTSLAHLARFAIHGSRGSLLSIFIVCSSWCDSRVLRFFSGISSTCGVLDVRRFHLIARK